MLIISFSSLWNSFILFGWTCSQLYSYSPDTAQGEVHTAPQHCRVDLRGTVATLKPFPRVNLLVFLPHTFLHTFELCTASKKILVLMERSFLGGLSSRGVDFTCLSSDLFHFCYSDPFVLLPYHRYYNSSASELWFLRNMMGFRLSKCSLNCFGEALRWTGKYKGNFSREMGFLPPMHIWMDSVISLFWSLTPLSLGEYWLQSKPICSKQLLPLYSRLPWLSLPEGIFFNNHLFGDSYVPGLCWPVEE